MVLVVGIFLLLYFGGTWLIKRQAGGKPWLGKAQVILFFLSAAIAGISGLAVAEPILPCGIGLGLELGTSMLVPPLGCGGLPLALSRYPTPGFL
ncbi:hypothetical protein NON20_10755 [Synechocystis sp. B12]|nr:hypothetical protein NON20_10755 [Synechocystis sp. B12]